MIEAKHEFPAMRICIHMNGNILISLLTHFCPLEKEMPILVNRLPFYSNKYNKIGKYPCGVCWQGVGYNSILYTSCNCWVHKKCSGVSGSLSAVRDFTCKRCSGFLPRQDDIPNAVTLNGDYSLDVVQKFCYLDDMLDAGGGPAQSQEYSAPGVNLETSSTPNI